MKITFFNRQVVNATIRTLWGVGWLFGATHVGLGSEEMPGWGSVMPPTTLPGQYATASAPGGFMVQSFVVDPDPGDTGIVYSAGADNPASDPDFPGTGSALYRLAASLGNDPIKLYEWVRNNVRTEFYFGCKRGAYLTYLERAGNDLDQCALLGALFRAAGYTPTYSLDMVTMPRSASGINTVGAYEWLGVEDDSGAMGMLSLQVGAQFSGSNLTVAQAWVKITISSNPVRFAPSIKPYTVGRRPNLDALSGYSLANARSAAGASTTGLYSPAISSSGLRTYLNGLVTAASDAIRADVTAHDLDGPELARLPVIVPEVVSITAGGAGSYPGNVSFTGSADELTGIPVTYCDRLRVTVGTVDQWFICPELLGGPLAVEFNGAGDAIVRHNGGVVGTDTSGGPGAYVDITLTHELAVAFYAWWSQTTQRSQSVIRQNAVAISYSFGSAQGRLAHRLHEIAEKEVDPAQSVTLTDRLEVIGLQYGAQIHQLGSLAATSLQHEPIISIQAGFCFVRDGKATVSIPIYLRDYKERAAGPPQWQAVSHTIDLLVGALEGTTIEQMSGARGYGTPTYFDYAMTLGRSAYLVQTVAQFNSISWQNLSQSDANQIIAYLNAGREVVLLADSAVADGSTNLFGYYAILNGSTSLVASRMAGGFGGAGTTDPGTNSVAEPVNASPTTATTTNQTHPVTTSPDPVDLSNGAFLKDDVDLMVGGDGPNGLRLERNYNSARRLSDPTGLGRGWTHNYDMRLSLRSPNDLNALRSGYDEVLPVIIAARFIQNTLATEVDSARSWLMASVAATWAADQQINSRAAVALGARSLEFVRRPDGSYAPPGNLTATLTKQGDASHDLAFRHGHTVHFRASDGKFTSITDQHDNTLTAAYDGYHRLQTVTDAYSRTFTFSYDGTGRLTGVSDSTGRSVAYGLTGGGHFTFTDAEGKVQTCEMDGDHLLTKIIDARSRTVVENIYDNWHRVQTQKTFGDSGRTYTLGITPGIAMEQDPEGHRMWTYFDARGRKFAWISQANFLTTWSFDGADRLVQKITPYRSHPNITYYAYNAAHVMVSETNPYLVTRTIEYDAQSRPWKVHNFEGAETVYTYTAQHDVASITAPGGIVATFEYDARGRLWKHHPPAYAANEFDVYAYDANGHINTVTHPVDANPGDPDYDDHTYDARGNLTELIDRKGVRTTYAYNARRQRTQITRWEGATPYTTQTVYDDAGDIDYTLDASGRKIDHDYDALGHLLEQRGGPIGAQTLLIGNLYNSRNLLAQSTDGLDQTIAYTYTPTQKLGSVTDPLNRQTQYGYDQEDNRTSVRTPLGVASGAPDYQTTYVWDGHRFNTGVQDALGYLVDNTYDEDGRLIELGNRLNHAFTWDYDDDNRTVTAATPTGKTTTAVNNTRGLPASVTEPSTQATTFTSYDAEGRLLQKSDGVGTTTYTYWPNGLLKTVNEGGKTTTRIYDYANRLNSYSDGEGNTISYTYTAAGDLQTITYPGSKTVTYTYDAYGRLWQVTDWSSRVTTYSYDLASRLTRIDRPNGTYRINEYDAAGQLRFIKDYHSNDTLLLFEEARYDADGRITYQFLHPKPAAVNLPDDSLLYDADNRLSTWNSQTVTFDADGNMTNGPLPTGTFGTYGYDSRNRLTGAGGSTYRYSPDGLRVEITGTGAATFVVDPNAALSRTLMRTQGGTTTYYVYGLDLLYEETSGAIKTYHYDHLGNTVALADSGTSVSDTWSYAPFGAVTQHTGSSTTPFQFNGALGVMTEANGLYHMRARYYNPRLMRFVNADPIGFDGGMNWYTFAGNNPIIYADPDGHLYWAVTGAIGGLVDFGSQVAIGMVQGQSLSQSVSNVSWTSVGISTGASAAGYGLLSAAGKAAEAYQLIKVGSSAAKTVYTVGKGTAGVKEVVATVGTQVVKEEMVDQGVKQAVKAAAAVTAVQVAKQVAKAASDDEAQQKQEQQSQAVGPRK